MSNADQPLVTVVTATFNALGQLQKTVTSVAEQSFGLIEHIVVDGNSTDGTRQFLEDCTTPLEWVSERDDGIADAMNKGVAMASGRYIIFLHAGDVFINADSLGDASIRLGDADLVSFNVVVTRNGTKRIYRSGGFGPKLKLAMSIPHQGLFCRKTVFSAIGGFDPRYRVAMDYDFVMRASHARFTAASYDEEHTIMPGDGVSSRTDWPAMSARLKENQAIQMRLCDNSLQRFAYRLFWTVYPVFKRFKHRRAT